MIDYAGLGSCTCHILHYFPTHVNEHHHCIRSVSLDGCCRKIVVCCSGQKCLVDANEIESPCSKS